MVNEPNIHERIYNELQRRAAIEKATHGYVPKTLEQALHYEQKTIRRPSQGMWVMTDFGVHIDPINDLGLKLSRGNAAVRKFARFKDRFEKRGGVLINTKIPHILQSLSIHGGGATTGKILEDIWFTTTNEFYGNINHLRGSGRKEKISIGNKTVGYFMMLLNWQKPEPIVRLAGFEPDPLTFAEYSREFNSLGKIVRRAMSFGFGVNFARLGDKSFYYSVALPEHAGGKLAYDVNRTEHYARIHVDTGSGLRDPMYGKLRIGTDEKSLTIPELETLINTYGEKWFKQRKEEARAYREQIGLR